VLDDAGKPLGFEMWFRGWSDRGFWMNENRLYKGTVDGRLTWRAQSRAAPGAAPGPRPQPRSRAQEVFVGRERELDAIAAAVLPVTGAARPVAICALQGMPGVGKSYLADRFAHLHRDRFPGGYLKLALERSGRRRARRDPDSDDVAAGHIVALILVTPCRLAPAPYRSRLRSLFVANAR
jgi:hypothetical protein